MMNGSGQKKPTPPKPPTKKPTPPKPPPKKPTPPKNRPNKPNPEAELVHDEGNGVIVWRLPTGSKHPKTGETLTEDGVWIQRENGAGKIKRQENLEGGAWKFTVKNNKGVVVKVFKAPAAHGSTIQASGKGIFSISYRKKRPWDDGFNDRVVTEDMLRRWRAKQGGFGQPHRSG